MQNIFKGLGRAHRNRDIEAPDMIVELMFQPVIFFIEDLFRVCYGPTISNLPQLN